MRVVHLCNLPLFPGHPDFGRLTLHPGRWVLNLALAQRACEGIDAHLVVQVAGASEDFETEVEGVPVHYVAAPARFRAATLFWFDRRRLSKVTKRLGPDLVHAHGTEEANLLAAQATGLPSLVTIQGLIGLIAERMKADLSGRYKVTEWTEKRALRRARHAIAKSEYIAGELSLRFPNLEIHRIPNTYDAALELIPTANQREHALAFVGTLDPRKGVHLVVEALRILKRDQVAGAAPEKESLLPALHIFGNRPGSASPYEQSAIEDLRSLLGERLVLHGTIPALDVAKALSRVTALVAPSVEEMFGNQLIEALLVGTHGIVTDETAMAENVRKFGNGTVIPQNDPVALANAIRRSLAARGACEVAECEAARRRVVESMGPAVVARAHRQLYEKILRRS